MKLDEDEMRKRRQSKKWKERELMEKAVAMMYCKSGWEKLNHKSELIN